MLISLVPFERGKEYLPLPGERRSSSDFTPVRNDSIPDVVETIGAQTRGRTEQVVPRKLLYFLLN
jgi:hypothetical protein